MKKIVIGLVTLGLLLSLTGCGKGKKETETEAPCKEKETEAPRKEKETEVLRREKETEVLRKKVSQYERESQTKLNQFRKETLSQKKEISNLASEMTRVEKEKEAQERKISNLKRELVKTKADLDQRKARIHEAYKESVVILSANGLRGTGFIINDTGYMLTTGHLAQSHRPYQVTFIDGQSYPCRVIVFTKEMDLALLKIEADRAFTPVKLGYSSKLMVSESVIAMGNAKGMGLTVASGIVSALDRTVLTDYTLNTNLIQVDAGVCDGYSGGPLFNMFGEGVGMIGCTVGVNTNFAIPIDKIRGFLPEMLEVESRYGFILGLKVATNGPATVTEVAEGSPAEAAGVRVDDLVTDIDGTAIKRGIDFYFALVDRCGGETLPMKLRRNNTSINAVVTLGKVEPRPSTKIVRLAGNGLNLEYYKGKWSRLPDFNLLKRPKRGVANTFTLEKYKKKDFFGLRFMGYIKVPEDGVYVFYTISDDGSQLCIGDRLVVNNDGLHGPIEQRGFISLKAGLHPITVTAFERAGEEHLEVYYKGPGIKKQAIPKSVLYRVRAKR